MSSKCAAGSLASRSARAVVSVATPCALVTIITIITIIVASVVSAAELRAQTARAVEPRRDPHEAQPERPTVATHAGTVAPGWVELESGVEADRYPGDARILQQVNTLKIGLAPALQLNLFGGWLRNSGGGPATSGVGDVNIGVKWRLTDDAPIVGDFALLPVLKLPTGSVSRGTGTGTADVSLLLISSHVLGPVALDVNAGYTRRSGDGANVPRSASLWTISTGAPVAGMLGWAAELYGYPGTSGPSGAAPIVAVLTGPTMQVHPWLVFDVGFIAPVRGTQPHALYAGLVWNIGSLPGGVRRAMSAR